MKTQKHRTVRPSAPKRLGGGISTWVLFVTCALTVQAEHAFRLISEMDREFFTPSAWRYEGWRSYNVSYYDVVEASTNMTSRALGDVTDLPCELGKTLPSGTYSLWVALATQGGDMNVACPEVGDTSVAPLQYSGNRWTKLGEFTSGVSFSNLTLQVSKLLSLGERQVYWFAGVGVTPTNLAPVEDFTSARTWQPAGRLRWADFTPVTVSNVIPSLGNLLHNSSFEVNGLKTAGWSSGRYPTNPVIWLSDMANGEGWHGEHSAVISSEVGSRYGIDGPTLFLPGDRELRPYTLSFYAKSQGESIVLSVYWNHSLDGAAGLLTNETQQLSFTIDSDWTRYETNLWMAPVPNRGVWFDFTHVSGASVMFVDAIQFEAGTAATPYAPADPVELGLSTPHANGNLFGVNENRVINYEFWNSTGTNTRVSVRTEVYDYMNQRVANLTNEFDLDPGFNKTSLILPTTNMGQSRVVAWCNLAPSFRTEMAFTVAPSVPFDAQSAFGIHGVTSVDAGTSNVAWGLGWQRGLSVAGFLKWSEIEPTMDNYSWEQSDLIYRQMTNSGYEIFASFAASLPAWAVTNGVPRLDRLSNYMYQAVLRYPDVEYWESINEPSGANDTVGAWTAETYAPIEETLIHAVLAANPNARYLALGGASEVSWGQQVWGRLSPTAQSRVYGISCHLYAIREGGTLPDDDTRFERWQAFGAQIGKPVWNTEAGVWGWGIHKGDKLGGSRDLLAVHPHQTEHDVRRMNWEQPAVAIRNVINSLGNGFERYFYYDARLLWYDWKKETTQPSLFEFDDSLNTVGAAYLWAKHFIDLADSTAQLTNSMAGDVRAYVFERASPWSTLALFTRSRQAHYSVTMTEPAMGIYDMMGNPLSGDLQAFEVGSRPVYVISSSTNLINAFLDSTIMEVPDTTAPHVSIDLSPHGRPTERSMPHRIWLTAIDDLRVPGDETPNNVFTRWRFLGEAWSDWSMQRYFELETTPALTLVEAQAMDLDGNTSEIIQGPLFGRQFALAVPAPPTEFQAVLVSDVEFDLNWTDNANNEFGFRVERSTNGITFSKLAEVAANVTSYTETNLIPSTLYFYRVMAFNNAGFSSYAEVSAATPLLPQAPSNLVAVASFGMVELEWEGEALAESHHVKRSLASGGPYNTLIAGLIQTHYTDTDVTNGVTYYYVVNGTNVYGAGPDSLVASATPLESSPVAIIDMDYEGGQFLLSIQTVPGKRYVMEATEVLPTIDWKELMEVEGDGTIQSLGDPSATNDQRYYRVRID